MLTVVLADSPLMPSPRRQHPPDLSKVDLVPLLKHLKGRRRTQIQKAQSVETRLLLQAGLQLIDEHFSEPPSGEEVDLHQAFRWVSTPTIAHIVVENKPDQHLRPNSKARGKGSTYWARTKEQRWLTHDDFLADLLNVALHTQHWSVGVVKEQEELLPLMEGLTHGDFVESVRELAYLDVSVPIDSPSFQRMELLAVAMCEREPDFKPVIRNNYLSNDAVWIPLYEAIFHERGWRPRPGFTMRDLHVILSTAAVGMGMRGSVTTDAILDKEARTSLLGKLALALIAGCVDTGDGRSLDEVVQGVVDGSRSSDPLDESDSDEQIRP